MKAKLKTTGQIVRPKASKRKGRTTVVGQMARAPTQERSQKRVEDILSATRDLLESARIEGISFYDIAKKAGMSPASIHYFFPSMAALRLELMNRYNRDLVTQMKLLSDELARS